MKEKVQRTIVESLHLSTMATSYNTHFVTYSSVITQLIPTAVWKAMYNDYVIAYSNSPFHDDTLKDWFARCFKES
jgi:hypothetical protein